MVLEYVRNKSLVNPILNSDPLAELRDEADLAREPRVLISVLNYKSVDDSVIAIRSLQQQDYPNFRLQLLDNASPNDCPVLFGRFVLKATKPAYVERPF